MIPRLGPRRGPVPSRVHDKTGIATACQLSLATVANMRQNLVFAFLYNALGLRRARLTCAWEPAGFIRIIAEAP